jgi:hypothetical protein
MVGAVGTAVRVAGLGTAGKLTHWSPYKPATFSSRQACKSNGTVYIKFFNARVLPAVQPLLQSFALVACHVRGLQPHGLSEVRSQVLAYMELGTPTEPVMTSVESHQGCPRWAGTWQKGSGRFLELCARGSLRLRGVKEPPSRTCTMDGQMVRMLSR